MGNEPRIIVDTGPLVALLRKGDQFHEWATAVVRGLPSPFITSEAVISEACYLLERDEVPVDPLFAMFSRGAIVVDFDLQGEWPSILGLMKKFSDMPKGRMSLADAILVRLAELHDEAQVFTVESHFRIYRKHGRRQIPLIIPESVR